MVLEHIDRLILDPSTSSPRRYNFKAGRSLIFLHSSTCHLFLKNKNCRILLHRRGRSSHSRSKCSDEHHREMMQTLTQSVSLQRKSERHETLPFASYTSNRILLDTARVQRCGPSHSKPEQITLCQPIESQNGLTKLLTSWKLGAAMSDIAGVGLDDTIGK